MSYILNVIPSKNIRSPKEAEDFIFGEKGKPSTWGENFALFRNELMGAFPDDSNEDDEGGGLWTEGIPHRTCFGEVLRLSISEDNITQESMQIIGQIAGRNGLACFDEEGQTIFK